MIGHARHAWLIPASFTDGLVGPGESLRRSTGRRTWQRDEVHRKMFHLVLR